MNLSEYAAHDAVGLTDLMRRGEVSARELHDTALAAIEALNPQLNAVVTRAEADAAHALANLDPDAPFAGLPFLMKDGGVMAGQRHVMGARFARELLCPADAEFTRRLKRSGVVILGSTNAPEFGNSCTTENLLDGPARNPWNLAHSTGGSSGGASAAVAAGIVPAAHTSDGGGSIRTPAHCCGVFGLKPSRGRNPVGPQQSGGPFGYGVHHVSTRSVRDSAAFLDVLHGNEPGAWYRAPPPARPFAQEVGADPGRLRIAFSSVSPSPFATSPECVAAVSEAARLCESLGHHVEEAAPCYDWEAFRTAFNDNWVAGVPSRVAHLESLLGFKIGPEHLEPCNWANLQYARTMTIEQYQLSMTRLFALTRDVESFFEHFDVLLTPVNRGPAVRLGLLSPDLAFEGTLGYWDRICAGVGPYLPIFNANGQPAMSVPFTTSATGLPIGIHCVARFGDEAGLLRLASQIESARPWAQRRPPVHVAAPVIQGLAGL